jgi:ribosome biogenesis GTPase
VARKLVWLPGGGALIDTPGLRSIGLLGAETGLRETFPEIAQAAQMCRYRDCTHTSEPACAVVAAVAQGSINPRRLGSYCVLAREVWD